VNPGYLLLAVALTVFAVAAAARATLRRVVVFEWEQGLRYVNGRFRGIIEPGRHWVLGGSTTIRKLDVRPRFVSIPGQEVLSSDGVTVKVSLVARFEISDLRLTVESTSDFLAALYLELQLAARDVVGSVDIETLLATRAQLSARLLELGQPHAAALGLRLTEVGIKDIMFTGRLKETFAQVVTAKQEGLAALERARGESASLRNLANAARLLDDNPNLMQLRVLQAVGESSGNTVVIGVPSAVPLQPRPAGGRSLSRRDRAETES
jgi:regulator of protease activity HflC (stomatin/prohibitin superfamily)